MSLMQDNNREIEIWKKGEKNRTNPKNHHLRGVLASPPNKEEKHNL
jgi:hypothetical protein